MYACCGAIVCGWFQSRRNSRSYSRSCCSWRSISSSARSWSSSGPRPRVAIVSPRPTGGERQLEPFGLPRERLSVQPDARVGVARGGVHPWVAGVLALGLEPRVVGLLVASGPQQQVSHQRLRAGMIVELAVPAGDRLAHRVDRLIEAAELLVREG